MDEAKTDAEKLCSTSALNSRTPAEQAQLFLSVLQAKDLELAKHLAKHILHLVDIEAIPWRVHSVLVCVVVKLHPSFNLIELIHSLQKFVFLQEAVILILIRTLRKRQWRTYWDAYGGLSALCNLSTSLSANHLYILLKGVNYHFAKPWVRTVETQQFMQHLLLHCLEHDKRPLYESYAKLVPACGEDFIRNLEACTGTSSLNYHVDTPLLVSFHPDLYRDVVLSEDDDCSVGYRAAFLYLFKHINRDAYHLQGFDPHDPKRFAMEVLSRIASGQSFDSVPVCAWPNQHWIGQLLECLLPEPLAETSVDKILPLLELVAEARRQHPRLFPDKYKWRRRVLTAATLLWSKEFQAQSSQFEKVNQLLQDLYSGIDGKKIKTFKKFLKQQNLYRQAPNPPADNSIFPYIPDVSPRQVRYPLFRRLVQILHPDGLDIDVPEELELIHGDGQWNSYFFLDLEFSKAAYILRNFGKLSDRSTLAYSNHDLFRSSTRDALLLYLEPVNLEAAKQIVRSRQFKAEREVEPHNRSDGAEQAFACAIGSKSQIIYRDNLRWSRRFIKDPVNFGELQRASFLKTQECRDLLVGFEYDDSKEDIQKKLKPDTGLDILSDHLDMMLSAAKEPGANVVPKSVLELMKRVTLRRLYIVCRFRAEPDFDQLVSLIIKPSFDLLIRTEEAFLELSIHVKNFQADSGILTQLDKWSPRDMSIRNAPPSVRSLLDKYCEKRNDIWVSYRSQNHFKDETLLRLPDPYPRGLPIQKLLPPAIGIRSLQNMPYLQSRVKKILELPSLDPDTSDKIITYQGWKTEDPIWTESYLYAIKLHFLDLSAEQRKRRARELWDQIKIRNLYGRPLEEEELRQWGNRFISVFGEYLGPPMPPKQWMTLRGVENGSEWSPVIGEKAEGFTSKSLKLPWRRKDTVLLDMLRTKYEGLRPDDSFRFPDGPGVWPMFRPHRLPHDESVRTAFMLSSILYLDSTNGRADRFLPDPFPSLDNQRFPSVYLDTEFFENVKDLVRNGENYHRSGGSNNPRMVIRALIKEFPPSLLQRFLERCQDSVSREGRDQYIRQDNYFKVLRLLMGSNTPHLATPFLRDVFLNQPQNSSWVRRLVTANFLKRLGPKDAVETLGDLEDEMLRRLEKQQERQGHHDQPSDPDAEYAVIKITVVKHLPQIIGDVGIFSYADALGFLSKIFEVAAHRDVILKAAQTVQMISKALGEDANPAFETLRPLIPRVAGPHERTYRNADMLTSPDGELPLTYTPGGDIESGDLRLIKCLFVDMKEYVDEETRPEYLNTILLPIVDLSEKLHGLWLEKFVRMLGGEQYGHLADDVATHLPQLTFYPDMRNLLIKEWGCDVPRDYLQAESDVDLTYVSFQHFKPIDDIVKSNEDISLEMARDHWKWVRDQQKESRATSNMLYLAMEEVDWEESEWEQAKAHIMSIVLEKFKFHLDQGSCGRSAKILRTFERIWNHSLTSKVLDSKAISTWRTIIDTLEEQRTSEWQQDPDRKPARLPQTFKSKLALLDWPSPTDEPDMAIYSAFTSRLREFLRTVIQATPVYHNEMNTVKNQLQAWRQRVDSKACMMMALALGDVGVPDQAEPLDLIFVHLSRSFFRNIKNPRENIPAEERDKFAALVRTWKRSSLEAVREIAFGADRHIRKAMRSDEADDEDLEMSQDSEQSASDDDRRGLRVVRARRRSSSSS